MKRGILMTVLVFAASPCWSFTNAIPASCPIPRSTGIEGITITDQNRTYDGSADTWFPVWAGNGAGYSPFMDGLGANGNNEAKVPGHPKLGFARIDGNDPLHLAVTSTTLVDETTEYGAGPSAQPAGRYACTVLPYKGVLYLGSSYRFLANGMHFLRPFAGFDISTDDGKTWTKRSAPLFPEAAYPDIKIGEPHFVDFGPELKNSPDDKAYLVAFGAKSELAATRPAQSPTAKNGPENPHWNWGDCVYLLRVAPSPETVNDPASYEFFAGNDAAGRPVWTHDFSRIKPVVEWPDHMGQAAVTYLPALKKYIMCVGSGADYSGHYDTSFLEADALTGPWRIAACWTAFGTQAYFVNMPSKFAGTSVQNGALTAWIVYSANFTGSQVPDPPGSAYAMCLRQVAIKVAARIGN